MIRTLQALCLLLFSCTIIIIIKTVYSLETQINRVMYLGRKIKVKHKPLLVSFENMDDKTFGVSRSYLLYHNEQYKMV